MNKGMHLPNRYLYNVYIYYFTHFYVKMGCDEMAMRPHTASQNNFSVQFFTHYSRKYGEEPQTGRTKETTYNIHPSQETINRKVDQLNIYEVQYF